MMNSHNPAIKLFVPSADEMQPELSIVIPALNEELAIAQFVTWCQEGIAEAGVKAEILIVDSSTDRTFEIALAMGARVLKVPKRGLGRAYIDSIPYIRGKYVLMGDADCTYDFRKISEFVQKFREGYEFVMGSRFRGSIEDGAMPGLHRYFGTPVTTAILNTIYGTKFSDIHCGMRGITREALNRLGLVSQSWEYASEMILKAVHCGLRSTEVPVTFLKDIDGRHSHHVRAGWSSPWKAGWINLKAMLVFGADFFLFWPGALLFSSATVMLAVSSQVQLTIGSVQLGLNAQAVMAFCGLVGAQFLMLALAAKVLYDKSGQRREKIVELFDYNRVVSLSAFIFCIGFVLMAKFVITFIESESSVSGVIAGQMFYAILGAYLMSLAFALFTHMLVINGIQKYTTAN